MTKAVVPVVLALGLGLHAEQQPAEVRYPPTDAGIDTLAARAEAQQQTAGQFEVFHRFRFDDRLKESGIAFVHRVVDDAGLTTRLCTTTTATGLPWRMWTAMDGPTSTS